MNRALLKPEPGDPAFHVRSTADINRLAVQLFTRWNLPRVEFHFDSLPAAAVQLAHHRILRITEAPWGGFAALLAGMVFLGGIFMSWSSVHSLIWTSDQLWERIALSAIAGVYAGLLALGAGSLWKRIRLMLVLRVLRRQILAGGSRVPLRYEGRVERHRPTVISSPIDMENLEEAIGERASVMHRARRSSVIVGHKDDIRRLAIHLLTHWRMPSVRISVDGVAPLEVQRAQHRIVQLFESCSCLLAATLAGATILFGSFVVQWTSTQNWDWWVPVSWGALGIVPLAALGAATVGAILEMLWNRVRLLLALRGVRHRLH